MASLKTQPYRSRHRGVTLIPTLIYAAVATAASYVVSKLTTQRPKNLLDNRPTTLADRGSIVPKVIGRMRIGYVFAWAGLRVNDTTSSGGKGGLLPGSGGQQSTVYKQAGWHQIAVGPVDTLYAIYQNGKAIWSTPLNRAETPSGSTFFCANNQGTFSIYWGECDQPINGFLGNKKLNAHGQPAYPGVSSRWPRMCYILWHPKLLGSSPLWPQMEYEIEARMDSTVVTLTESSAWLDSTTGTGRNGNDGVNPAHALWMLITAPFPDGAGIDPTDWNISKADFEALGVLCESEHIGINLVLINGQNIDSCIADILGDITTFLVQDGDRLLPKPIRGITDLSTIPTIVAGINSSPDPEIERIQGNAIADRIQFTIKDKAINFHDFTISYSDDSLGRTNNRPKIQRVGLPTITDRYTAYYVGQRRRLEYVDRVSFRLTLSRGARSMLPGQAFNFAPYGVVRVMDIQLSRQGFSADLDCLLDQYTLNANGITYDDPGGGIVDAGGALPDILVVPFIIPQNLRPNPSLNYFGVARVRADADISGAATWMSIDGGSSYQQVGEQDMAAAGGTLNSALTSDILADKGHPLVVGPTITSYNDDIQNVPDYSGNDTAWHSGQLICIIDQEVFFIQSVSAVTGGYQLNNMIRGQYGTAITSHSVNAPCVIFGVNWVKMVGSAALTGGSTEYIKTVPFTFDSVADITTITPVPLVVSDNSTATLTLTYPITADVIWRAGTQVNITWKATGNQYTTTDGNQFTGGIDVFFSVDNGDSWNTIVTNTTNSGTYQWTVPAAIASNEALIRIASHVTPTLIDQSPVDFVIAAPMFTIITPTIGQALWLIGQVKDITWSPILGSPFAVDILYTPDQTNWVTIASNQPNSGTYSWTIPVELKGSYHTQIRVRAYGRPDVFSTSSQFEVGPL